MKKFLCFQLLLLCGFSFGQVTLTSSLHGIVPGLTSSVLKVDTTGFNPGASGSAQTWNFSSLFTIGTAINSNYVDPSTTPYSSVYSSATVSNGDGSGGYSYYIQSGTELDYIGGSDGVTYVYYFDPLVVNKFPFSFGDGYVDNFSAYYSGVSRTGTMTLTADGSGTLILPSGSYSALRVKSIENYTDSTSSVVVHVNIITYNWYIATEHFPVLQYSIAQLSGSTSSMSKQLLMSAAVVGIEELSNNEIELNTYPNPATDIVTLEFYLKEEQNVSIELKNVLGQSVFSSVSEFNNGSNRFEINMKTLPKGIYLAEVQCGNGHHTKRIIKR